MGVFPQINFPHLVTINSFSMEALGGFYQETNNSQLNTLGSVVFPSANRAIFIPFFVGTTFVVKNMFILNGATTSGNIDVGVYTADGTKLWSAGSTAQSGTSALQAFSVSNLELAPAQYYMAVAMDNTTGTLYRMTTGTVNYDRANGMAQMATAFPLPATATLASLTTAFCPLLGLTTRSFV